MVNHGSPIYRKCSPQILTGDLICDFSTTFCGSHRPCLRPILGSSLADPAAVTDGMQSKSHVFSEEPYHIHDILDWEILLTRCNLFLEARQAACFSLCWHLQVGPSSWGTTSTKSTTNSRDLRTCVPSSDNGGNAFLLIFKQILER